MEETSNAANSCETQNTNQRLANLEFMITTIMGIVQGTRQPLLLPQPQPPHLEEVKQENQAPFLRINYLLKNFLNLNHQCFQEARMQSKPTLGWLQKVRLAAYQLEGEARRWWTMKKKAEPVMD